MVESQHIFMAISKTNNMDQFRKHQHFQKILVVMVFLGLLLQVQTVFACQMMDHGGLAKDCCCDEMKAMKGSDDTQESSSPCCDFSSELTFKGTDLEDEDPVVVQSQASFELPQATFILILTSLWQIEPDRFYQQPFWDTEPGHPGTDTYLSTLRLRI